MTLESSTGDSVVGGVSSVSSIEEKGGYTGQLYDPESVSISAVSDTVNESGTRQLSANVVMDDSTILAVTGEDLIWNVMAGPFQGVSSGGLVTADVVYQDTPGSVQGDYKGVLGLIGLTVLNTNTDNFGSYGGDVIDDAWQVSNFGAPPNANAAAASNPDGDNATNYDEWITGFDPNDPSSFFQFQITGVNVGAGTADLQINKVIPGSTYTVKAGTGLTSFPETVSVINPLLEELNKGVQDAAASSPRKFYTIEVTKP